MKERIIGAAVLVVVVVLIVPVFLDGPPGENEVVSTNVPLPGQSEQDTRTVVLERDRKDPVPASTSNDVSAATSGSVTAAAVKNDAPPASAEAPKQQPEVQKSDAQPTPAQPQPAKVQETSEPATSTSLTGMWAVQLGSFSNQKNAEGLAAELRKKGFAAFLSQLPTDSGQLQRVRIGPQKDRESAEAMAERLRKAGYKGKVLPHP